jgi:anti-anti-sigma factor
VTAPLAHVDVQRRGADAVVATLTGEIDGSNIADVQAAVADGAKGARKLILVLTEIGYMDSQGLRWLVQLAGGERETTTIVAAPTSICARTIWVAGLTASLGVVATVPESAAPRDVPAD